MAPRSAAEKGATPHDVGGYVITNRMEGSLTWSCFIQVSIRLMPGEWLGLPIAVDIAVQRRAVSPLTLRGKPTLFVRPLRLCQATSLAWLVSIGFHHLVRVLPRR